MTGEGLHRSSPFPLYHQLKQVLLAEIEAQGLGPGARLPGDHELCARFDVSRTVVRQALSELEFEGVLERVRGRGTFVAQRRPEDDLSQSLTGLFEAVAVHGGVLRTKVVSAGVVPAPTDVALALQIPPGSPVTELERVRYVQDEPWAHTRTYVPETLAPGLAERDLTSVSLYDLLEHAYGVRLLRGRSSVEAVVADAELAAHLDLAPQSPVLVLSGVSAGEDGRPVESFVTHHRGDRSRVEVDLRRRTPAPGGPPSPPLVVLTG